MAKEISKLFVTLGLDDKDFAKGLDKMQKNLSKIGKGMTAVGASITASFGLMTKEWADAGDEIQEMSQRTGFATKSLSELRYAAELSGANLSELEKASRTLSGAITDAGKDNKTYIQSLKSIGLSYEKLKELSPEDQFMKVLDAIAGVSDETRRAAIAQDLFGKSGTDLLPLLADGTSGLSRMRAEAHKLGIVFDNEAADSAAALKDALAKLKGSFEGIGAAIARTLAPIITNLAERISKAIIKIKDWMKENPGLSRTLIILTAAVGGLFSVIGPFLLMLPSLAAGITLVTGSMIGQTVAAIHAAFAVGGLTAGFNALKIAIMSNPLGLILTAIAAAIYLIAINWEKVLDGFRGGMDETSRAFERWVDDIRGNSDQMIMDIESAFSEWEVSARKTTSVLKDQLDQQLDAARDAHDERMKLLNEEEIAELAKVDKAAAFRLKALQAQNESIDSAIDERQRANQRAEEEARIAEINEEIRKEDNARVAEYNTRIREEKDVDRRIEIQEELADYLTQEAERKAELQKQLNDYIAQVEYNRWEQSQRDQQDYLSSEMDAIKEATEYKKQQIKEEYKAKREAEDNQLKSTEVYLEQQKEILDADLDARIANYTAELEAFKAMNDGKLEDVKAFVDSYNELMGKIGGEQIESEPPKTESTGDWWSSGLSIYEWLRQHMPSFAGWEGRIPGQEGAPYLATVHGGEYISQSHSSGAGEITNQFTINGLVVREEADIYRIARELFNLQQRGVRAGG